MSEEKQELTAEQQQAKDRKEFFVELAARFPNAPTEQQVDGWKSQNGRVNLLPLGNDEVYIYRALKNGEYNAILQGIMAGENQAPEKMDQFLKERVVCAAVLWPKLDPATLVDAFAGTLDSLFTAIRESSNFYSPQEVSMLIREL